MRFPTRRFFLCALLAVPISTSCSDDPTIDRPRELPDGSIAEIPIDIDGAAPDACTAVESDDATGVYVSSVGSTTAKCGVRAEPCKTIALGIARAATASKATVYVATGTYVERVILTKGVTISGGWTLSVEPWTRGCDVTPDATIVRAPSTENITFEAKNLGGQAGLEWLRIESKSPSDMGESLYGLFASGSSTTLRLDHVRIEVAHAGAGMSGGTGTTGSDGATSCTASTGDVGGAGTPGTGAAAGTFTNDGYAVTTGASGGPGTFGQNGRPGINGECVSCGTCDPVLCIINATGPACGGDGTPGCAGGPGSGGTAGTGGGSSFAVYAWDANVQISDSSLRAGNGGNGGNGGSGGPGGKGSEGAAGANTAPCTTFCSGAGVCTETMDFGRGGGAGTKGGNGGSGGAGGGGAGGSSIAIYQDGTGFVTTTSTTLAHGTAGKGGGPATGAGANGTAADRIP
ncbi:PE-PGRS virulence associated protein [Labilithrix luteola]|uniref:PE-PGRS virulence associated protein n=1 Tax=Labilithrix luteola TaxID=1391654 RepID=A0A0K1QEJ8_9BACT|nr:hypothetical protein [Labilithrix luteola]AKV04158.1 PE-PGRS virulence associated protein [Labilithrix luteola]